MTGHARPHFLWRGWAPAVAFMVIVALSIGSLTYTRNESHRHSVKFCEGQREGRVAFITQLREDADFLEPLVEQNPDQERRQAGRDYIDLKRHQAHDLERPLPCEEELGLLQDN